VPSVPETGIVMPRTEIEDLPPEETIPQEDLEISPESSGFFLRQGSIWAYEAVNPRFSLENQALDALNHYVQGLPRPGIEVAYTLRCNRCRDCRARTWRFRQGSPPLMA
jgi:hypothetical protein